MLFGRGPFMNAKHWRGVSNEIIFDRLAHWAQVQSGRHQGINTSVVAQRSPRGRLQSACSKL